jgi:hypothetical protein
MTTGNNSKNVILLNFACQVVAPGKAFSRRLINATCKVTKPHHRIRVSQEMREDQLEIILKT